MKSRLVLAALLSVTLGALGVFCGAVTSTPRFQLYGYTTAEPIAGTGPFGLTAACQAEFPGAGEVPIARVCTAEEAMTSVVLPTSRPAIAWVANVGQDHSQVRAYIDADGRVNSTAEPPTAPVACCLLLP